ncbi:uncharacterized protein LOC120186728 [Hibiscus syriacus]|uniref:uncharacterized protein LOC120186728 n=1 Tax=Hibiscus syriacus TaxID=106335 RepID=UPI001924833B|nr:uncharacterized protein LOC120186728 [Hibiscus syriacus]
MAVSTPSKEKKNTKKSSNKEKKTKKSSKANAQITRHTDSACSTDPKISPKRRRNSSPGVRLIHNRIYDSHNGKTCHQCRQKTVDFAASCKRKIDQKQCTIHFCHKCLLNRYGEKAEEVALLNDWNCPKCRGICNCSFCMSEGNDADFSTQKATPKKSRISKKVLYEGEVILDRNTAIQLIEMKVPKKCDQGEDEMLNNAAPIEKNKTINKFPSPKKKSVEVKSEASDDDIILPQGTLLNCVGGIGLPAEDVGHALQFLEFCEAFGEVLNMKKGQSQLILRELFTGKSKCKHKLRYPSIVQFHIRLLSMMQKDLGKEYPCLSRDLSETSWAQVLGEYISDSQKPLNQSPSDCLDMSDDRYEKLNSSKKLRLLNFLCDEALVTTEFRSWIDEQNSKFVEKEKKMKEKLLSRRERERNMEKAMKQKLQDEIAKAIIMKNGAPLSISENEELISRIKKEVAQTLEVAYTLAGTLEVSETVDEVMPKEEEDCRLDAVRSEPIFWDGHGHKYLKFWRLRGHLGESNILLQDIEVGDSVAAKERWYSYSTEQKATVEKYISSFRVQKK